MKPRDELLFYRPDSVLRLTPEDEAFTLDKMRGLSVLDARSEATETLEAIWRAASKRGVLFVWLRHFG